MVFKFISQFCDEKAVRVFNNIALFLKWLFIVRGDGDGCDITTAGPLPWLQLPIFRRYALPFDAKLEVKILDMNSQNLLVLLTFIEVSWGLEGY